ncbi:MAG: DUF6017 domain-containing protein [Oscillospiraceae bacterium]|nr:DUF6017 domain-containing protein [Oscillospiraceae bacterium]
MAVFRVEKNHNYTVMSNYHLRDKNLSLKASGLLSKMLSLTEEWNYTTRGLAAICKEGVDAIGSTLRELEANGYLVRTQLRDAKGRISDTEYVIYEQPHTPLPCTTQPDTEKPDMDTPDTEPPYPKKPAQLNIDIRNIERAKTDLFTTDISNPYPSNPPAPYGTPFATTGWDEMGYEEARETVMENLEYDILQERYSKERLDEIVDLLTETICSHKQTTIIAGDEYPTALVRDKLLKITPSHIEYVFDCLDRNTTYVRNIKKYILAALFNAPSTIDSYYSALVNHDLYGGSR